MDRVSLERRILEFFQRNPGEELRPCDIVTKFECHPRTAENALARLCQAGKLQRVQVLRLAPSGTPREQPAERMSVPQFLKARGLTE